MRHIVHKFTLGILLAAGASRRFGPDDKLRARLGNHPLAKHAAAALAEAGCDGLAVITWPENADLFPKWRLVSPPSGKGQGASLSAAAQLGTEMRASHMVVALADMPFVQPSTLRDVIARGQHRAAATTDGIKRLPPACFPASDFTALQNAQGDHGARDLLRALPAEQIIPVAELDAMDIDTPEQLQRAETLYRSRAQDQ